jgi:SAM-dependent methyltransferase
MAAGRTNGEDARLATEREFHNRLFTEGTRAATVKYYTIAGSSHRHYERLLFSRCAGRRVLEYGCGTSTMAMALARRGARLTGIDIADVAIEQAREQARREGLEASFLRMNAEALEFPDQSFDLVCGGGILHHLNVAKAAREIARVVRPEGAAVFIEPLGHNPLINLYRRLTPGLRTPDEHPLTLRDLEMLEEHFGAVEARFFHLTSVGAVLLRRLPGFDLLVKALDAIDRGMFAVLPVTRRYAWMVVLLLRRPRPRPA